MQAVVYEQFGQPPVLQRLPDPVPAPQGVVVAVRATGLCRSDWHGWMGHDAGIALPHVPGHELAGVVVAIGKQVQKWRPGDRVTVPFVCACGRCEYCQAGDQQVCPHQTQPGFTGWGSFAEYVALDHADENLVKLPDWLDDVTAASLGCRFATAFRGIVDQGKLQPGQWVAIHGCGGVGLSAIQIARAMQARVIAVDIEPAKLALAQTLGAEFTINARTCDQIPAHIIDLSGGGVHVSMDALGSQTTCVQSIQSLRKRGKHLQVGLMLAEHACPTIPFPRIIADELEIIGCHGMPAHRYPALLEMVQRSQIPSTELIGRTISLQEIPAALMELGHFPGTGVTIACL